MSVADTVFNFVMVQEGEALSLDPADHGNWYGGVLFGSKFGVTAHDLVAYMHPVMPTPADMRDLTRDTAECIFHSGYYQSMRGDDLPGGVALSTVDFGYNAGAATSPRTLQAVVGVNVDGWVGQKTLSAVAAYLFPDHVPSAGATSVLQSALRVPVDGAFGPLTRAALAAHPARNSLGLIAVLSDAQADHYRSLVQFSVYGRGWLARTWRRAGAAMALAGGSGAPVATVPVKVVPPAAVAHVQRAPDVVPTKPQYTASELDAIFNPTVHFTE